MTIFNIFRSKTQNNLYNTCSYLLGKLKTKYTQIGLSHSLEDHVEYPSILSLKDTFSKYGIESAAIRKGTYSYSDFETPFICSIQKEGWPSSNFTVVTDAESNSITYLDPTTNNLTNATVEDFEKIDKNIILLLDTDSPKDEVNLIENQKKQKAENLSKRAPIYMGIASILLALGFILFNPAGVLSLYGAAFIITSFIGLLTSILLVWHDVDAHNPFIKEVCGGNNKKVNCNAVLSSSKSSFLGISWSVWGFAYFASFFISQVLFPVNISFLFLWSILSIAAAPYMFFSIYYQWKVVKQWCPLCIVIQATLAINTIVAVTFLVSSFYQPSDFSLYYLSLTILLGFSILFLTYMAVPILKNANESKSYKKKWEALRYNPEIFQALLDKSEQVSFSVDNLGITVGNPEATNEIIKVCNPYCGPCAKAHPELEHIVKTNPDVKVRIIFTASGDENDIKTPPVAHLLAIQQMHGPDIVHTALDDWYMAPSKDYEAFAKIYPMNSELKQQTEKMHAMRDWCNNMKIRATPTIYINGRELPDSYRINELKNFF